MCNNGNDRTNERMCDRYLAASLILVIDWFHNLFFAIFGASTYAAYHMLFWEWSLKPTKVLSIGVVLYGFVYIMLYLPEEQNVNGTSLMWDKLCLNKLRKIKFYWPFWKKFIKAISRSKIKKSEPKFSCKKWRFELKMNYVWGKNYAIEPKLRSNNRTSFQKFGNPSFSRIRGPNSSKLLKIPL